MKRRTLHFALFFLALSPCAFAQSAPLDHAEILGRLAVGYMPSYVAHLVKTRGINFPSSADFISKVKLAGGDGILVERLSTADTSGESHSIAGYDPSFDHLAKCAEFIHTGSYEAAWGNAALRSTKIPRARGPYWPSIGYGIATRPRDP